MTNIRDLLKIAGVTLLGIVLTSSGSLFAASGRPGGGGGGASHGSHSGGGFHSGGGSRSGGSFGAPRTGGSSHSGFGSHSSSGFSGSTTPRVSSPRVSTEHRSPAVRETHVQRPSAPAARETHVQRPSAPAVREVQRSSAPAVREIQRPSAPAVREVQRPSAPAVREVQRPSTPAVRETQVQRPSTPAVREAQRPSTPAAREVQRPNAPAVREAQERSTPSARQNPQVQQANERVPGASRQVQRPNIKMEREASQTPRTGRQATEQREARQPARIDRTADSGTSGGQPHYSGGQRVTEQPASGTERQAGKRPVAPERRSSSVQPGNRPSQRSTNSHADRVPASKAPATGERIHYEGGKRVVEPAPGTERQAGKRNNPPARPQDANVRPGVKPSSRPGIAPVAPNGKPYPRPNVPAYPGHHPGPGPGPGPGYVDHHHHHHPAPPPPAPYRHYYPYHYYPYYSYPRYSWWVDVANFGIGFVTGYAYGSAYPYYYYYPTYYTTTTYPVSSGDTVIIQDNTIVVADDAANGNVANNVEAVPVAPEVAEPQVAQADDPKAVSILDKNLNEDLNVPAEDAVAKPAVDEEKPLSEEEAAKAAALQAELAKITKESVDSAWETLQKSDELFGQGKIDEAVTGYEKVAKEMRLMPDTYFRLSVADVAKVNYKDAIDQLNQGMEMSKNWPSSPFTLDYMYRERTDQKKADLAKLERMAAEWSEKADVQLLTGMMMYMDGQAEKATPYLQKAQSLDKNLEDITKPLLENIENAGKAEAEQQK